MNDPEVMDRFAEALILWLEEIVELSEVIE